MPHLIERDDHRPTRHGGLRKPIRRVANPGENRDVTDAEDAGDGAKAHVAHGIQKQGQGLHLRRFALGWRHREVVAARLAAVALHAPHDPILHVIRRLAALANDPAHDFRPLTDRELSHYMAGHILSIFS